MSPRCGVPDNDDHNKLQHTTKHYSLITGRPTWNHSTVPFMLTYALLPKHIIGYIKLSDIRVALEQAFSRWSSVIPVKFTETQDYKHANITAGFYYGDRRDGIPFDDRMLAVASGPRSAGAFLHFNAAHTWAVDFNSEKSKSAYDLETTAVHEIGHLLGLNHTSISEAVMWPYIGARTKHVNLALDDVNGAQALYGANPKFKLDPLKGKEVASSDQCGVPDNDDNNKLHATKHYSSLAQLESFHTTIDVNLRIIARTYYRLHKNIGYSCCS
ncbi:hypothetical protein MKX03_026322 [Papaver bracteatum]|nr:hypothetical protein MKX03_026322 [Papaver bracteatum]